MKYTVVCVGKLKERFWKDACAEYTKRLGAYAKVDIREVADIDPAKAGGVDAARDKEGAARSVRVRSSRRGSTILCCEAAATLPL